MPGHVGLMQVQKVSELTAPLGNFAHVLYTAYVADWVGGWLAVQQPLPPLVGWDSSGSLGFPKIWEGGPPPPRVDKHIPVHNAYLTAHKCHCK